MYKNSVKKSKTLYTSSTQKKNKSSKVIDGRRERSYYRLSGAETRKIVEKNQESSWILRRCTKLRNFAKLRKKKVKSKYQEI